MSPSDEHPEVLLDRAAKGALSPDEQRELEAHLDTCYACAAHHATASWFAGQQLLDPCRAERHALVVDGALAELAPRPALQFASRSRRWLWAVPAVAVMMIGAAAAAGYWLKRAPAFPPVSEAMLRAGPQSSLEVAVSKIPVAVSVDANPTAVNENSLHSSNPTVAPESRKGADQYSAAVLFERAGSLRREGKKAQSLLTYRQLEKSFPNSRESQLSEAIVGRLLLEQGANSDAVAEFDRYLSHGGPAMQEVLAGRAIAMGRLGRTTEEVAAWNILLTKFPRSVYADQARMRLKQME